MTDRQHVAISLNDSLWMSMRGLDSAGRLYSGYIPIEQDVVECKCNVKATDM